jgi:hypothetical protein
MNCQQARQHLMLYLDSEGDAELHLRISDHLALCPACAEWFTLQQRFEQSLGERLAEGKATPGLWERVLVKTGIQKAAPSRRRWALFGGALAAAAAAVLAVVIGLSIFKKAPAPPSELGPLAADWHEQLLRKEVQPELLSDDDRKVEAHLRAKVKFPVHCPPRKDVDFNLRGAGVCRLKDRQAAYIVGQVEDVPVSIIVLDRRSLDAFPHERQHLVEGGGRHHCREGKYQMVAGLIKENVVIVIGRATPHQLEKLLTAYGSYHDNREDA